MKRRSSLFLMGVLQAMLVACGDDGEGGGPAPTATAVPSATATRAPSATATSVATSTATFTATALPSATATRTPAPEGAVALFSNDPLSPANPFPTDRLLDASGHISVTGTLLGSTLPPGQQYDRARLYFDLVADQLHDLTGFSTFAPLRVLFSEPIATANAFERDVIVFPLDDPSVQWPIRVDVVGPEIGGDNAIEIQPLLPFEPKARYGYVVTRELRDAQGDPVQPSADLLAVLDPATTDPFGRELAPVLDALAAQGVERDEIAMVDIFTTQPTTDDLISIKNLLVSGTLPPADPDFASTAIAAVTTGIFPEGSPEFAELVGRPTSEVFSAVAVGVFPSYDFRFGPQSAFDPRKVSGEVTPSTNPLSFYMTIPKAPKPEGGYPIVIFQHGLGGDGSDAIGMAQRLIGARPAIGIGISAVEHPPRGEVANFFNLLDIYATREHFRQTVADLMQLERMVRNSDVPPFDQVDKSRIHYLGGSLGGIMGTLYLGVERQVRVGMLSVPGGGLPRIISESPAIGQLLRPILALTARVPLDDPFFPVFLRRFTQLSQWVTDPGDPINTGPYLIDPERRLPGVPEGDARLLEPRGLQRHLALRHDRVRRGRALRTRRHAAHPAGRPAGDSVSVERRDRDHRREPVIAPAGGPASSSCAVPLPPSALSGFFVVQERGRW